MATPPEPAAARAAASPSLRAASTHATTRGVRPGPLLVRADATVEMGVGHAMRCLALAQEAQASGRRVVLAGELALEWVAESYAAADVTVLPPPRDPDELSSLARQLTAAAVLLDGYQFDSSYGRALRRCGIRVGAMVDGPFGGEQDADLYIDQNPGSSPRSTTPPARAVAGAAYTLFRNDVLAAREMRAASEREPETGRPLCHETSRTGIRRVLAVFGGTDPFVAAPDVVPLIGQAAREAGVGIELEVVTREPRVESLTDALPPGSTLRTLPAVTDLAARAAGSDLVVTASGSTVWELLCIGVPTAVVCVVDNQTPGYDFSTRGDLVAGIGHLEDLREQKQARADGVAALREALLDEDVRARRSRAGAQLLDGRGRSRVLAALLPQ